jgi:hypothetical protein
MTTQPMIFLSQRELYVRLVIIPHAPLVILVSVVRFCLPSLDLSRAEYYILYGTPQPCQPLIDINAPFP